MKKTIVILILFYMLLSPFASLIIPAADTPIPYSSGTFGANVTVVAPASNDAVALSSGTFGTTVYIEYYQWQDWCDWWQMEYLNFSAPTNFAATHINTTKINLTWTKGTNATHTYIRRKTGGYPGGRGDGTLVVNTTNTWYDDIGLDPGTRYYYRAWSYESGGNIFTTSYASDNNYTNPDVVTNLYQTTNATDSITLSWTMGTNSDRTVIRYSNFSYPSSTTSNQSGYNGTASTYEISGLDNATTYYFTAWSYDEDSNLFSIDSINVSCDTLETADSPTNLVADSTRHNIIELTWTKATGTDFTRIVRKNGAYPDNVYDGVIVYNNGAGTNCSDSGLTPVVHYYYRAWGYNGVEYSSGYDSADNITLPANPTDFVGDLDGTTLNITWTIGTGAIRTVVRQRSDTYPTNETNGTLIVNTTNEYAVVNGVSTVDYYRGWSYAYLNDTHLYSTGTNLLWGGIEINVYKETEPSVSLLNYTVFIKNEDGTETYYNNSANNPHRIDVSDVPNSEGNDDPVAIQVSKDGYHTRTKYMLIYENYWYTVNFYLPPDTGGGGTEGEDDYIPPESDASNESENESYASHYIIQVVNEYDDPVENVKITIKRYINTTDEFETIYIVYSDGNGESGVDLIPNTIYLVNLNLSGYEDTTTDWSPPVISYSNDAYKTFRIYLEEETYINETDYNEVIRQYYSAYISGTTLYVNYTDTSTQTLNTAIVVYEINGSTSLSTPIGWDNRSNDNDFQISFSDINTSNCYNIILFLNHSVFGFKIEPLTICGPGRPYVDITSKSVFDVLFDANYGTNPFGWSNVFGFLVMIGSIFSFGQRNSGISLLLTGFVLLFINFVIGLHIVGVTVPVLFIVLGILVQWHMHRKEEVTGS